MAVQRKRSLLERSLRALNILILILIMLLCLYPFLYVLFASLSNPTRFTMHRGLLLHPLGFQLDSYQRVFENPSILSGFKNTLIYVVFGTALNIIMTSMGADLLSLRTLKLRRILSRFIVFTMFFSGGLIPTFLLVRDLGLLNSRLALILPTAISTYNMMIMRTSFESIPDSLVESAKIDGARDMTVLFRIILPLSLPIIATMVLFYGVAHWNSWFNAMVYLRDRELYPVQLILREILITNNTLSMTSDISSEDLAMIGHTIQYATIMVVIIPILILYPFLQKYFVNGIMIGAVKG